MSSQDDDTQIAEAFLSLEKENRRSGTYRRVEPDSARQFKREVEREYRAEIRQLREEETAKDLQIADLKAKIAAIEQWQNEQAKLLLAVNQIVNASIAFRWIIGFVLGGTMLIGGVSAAIDAVRSWVK